MEECRLETEGTRELKVPLLFGGGNVTDKSIDLTERLQKIGETVANYRDALMSHFKDMDVEVKDWHFSVGKVEKEYNVDVTVKLVIKPKTKA